MVRRTRVSSNFIGLVGLGKMEPAAEATLQFESFSMTEVLEKSITILKLSPKTFIFISLTLILPLSVAILARSLFSLPLTNFIPMQAFDDASHNWTELCLVEVLYPTFIFVFSLVSTGAMVFTVASLYTYRPVSCSSTLQAVPRVFKRLFITFLFFYIFLILRNVAVIIFLVFFYASVDPYYFELLFFFSGFLFYYLLFFFGYSVVLWHLASVISVVEPVYGLEAMKRSKALLKGRTVMAMKFVISYLAICVGIEEAFKMCGGVFIATLCVLSLVMLNLVGLLIQSVFYFMCKNYHEEEIDKGALFEHLRGYVGKYMCLASLALRSRKYSL